MINQRRFSRVVILDPHSPETPKRIHNVRIYPQSEVAKKLWQGYSGIISADKGGKERAEAMAQAMGLPVTYGGKTRDVSTGKLTGFTLEELPVKGGHYLVVDDICDGGGTFIGLGEKIREQGSYADLYVSHGIFSKGTKELKEIFKNIYTTDSRQVHERNDVLTVELLNEMRNYG
jgi:ribose-phosphate pyrophosphokinase